MKIADIAQATGLTHNAASRLVDRLVQAGYVSRAEDAHDRRQKRVELTPAGHALPVGLHSNDRRLPGRAVACCPRDPDRLAKAVATLDERQLAPASTAKLRAADLACCRVATDSGGREDLRRVQTRRRNEQLV